PGQSDSGHGGIGRFAHHFHSFACRPNAGCAVPGCVTSPRWMETIEETGQCRGEGLNLKPPDPPIGREKPALCSRRLPRPRPRIQEEESMTRRRTKGRFLKSAGVTAARTHRVNGPFHIVVHCFERRARPPRQIQGINSAKNTRAVVEKTNGFPPGAGAQVRFWNGSAASRQPRRGGR